jgi:hypothetical protein
MKTIYKFYVMNVIMEKEIGMKLTGDPKIFLNMAYQIRFMIAS